MKNKFFIWQKAACSHRKNAKSVFFLWIVCVATGGMFGREIFMDKKIWLVEGFCPVDRYTCLMPVEYAAYEENGNIKQYNRQGMVCRHVLSGECSQMEECEFLKKAPDVLGKNSVWYE